MTTISPEPHTATHPDGQRHLGLIIAAALFVALTGLYSLTYSGTFKSGDEYLFVSNAVSLGGWGELSATPDGLRAATGGNVEPLQALVGAGIYQLARLGQVGVVHALFLTNVYLMALTSVAVFYIVRQRGYRLGVAAAAALIFGLATQAWPHAKLYFRDPLAMFFTALALLSFERIFTRASWLGQGVQWGLTLGLLTAGILAKNTAVFVLPAFLISAGVRAVAYPAERRSVLVGLVSVAVLGGLAFLIPAVGPLSPFSLTRYLQALSGLLQGQVGPTFGEAIVGALVSPGKGLFVESPALLLAVAALPLLDKRERVQHLTPWLTLLGLVVGLAYYRIDIWYGGTGWGIRHLLPVVPMFAAATAPALEAVARSRRVWLKVAAAGLISLSVMIQVGAVLLHPEVYYYWLSKVSPGAAWKLAIWNPLYAEAVNYWRLLFSGGALDLAWLRLFPNHRQAVLFLGAASIAVVAAAVAVAGYAVKAGARRGTVWAAATLGGLALTVMPYGLLRVYYPDPYYAAQRTDIRAAAAAVTQAAQPGDAIIIRGLGDPGWKFFINYAYSPVAWFAYRPVAPSDTPSDTVIDEVPSAQVLEPDTVQMFAEVIPRRYARLWHLSDQCSDWAFLHLEERWLAQHYFAGMPQPYAADKCTTLVSPFALATAPAGAAQPVAFQFGEAIRLTGASRLAFAGRPTLKAGDILPLRLDWQLTRPVPMDYTIGVYLLNDEGALKAQQDSFPRGGFFPMTHWPLGTEIADQHGLELPANLPPGTYHVAVAIYDWQTGQRLEVRGASGPAPDNLAKLLTLEIGAP